MQPFPHIEQSGSRPGAAADLPPIQKRIVCINGFSQPRHGRTGMEMIWQHLRALHEQPHNGCRVSIHTWRDNWRDVVGHVLRTGPRDVSRIDVRVIGYSWGGGFGAMRFSRELLHEGISVSRMALCDPVYFKRCALWRSLWSPVTDRLFGEPRIAVPFNVRRVDYIRQQENRPRGHRVAGEVRGRTIVVNHGFVDGATHQDIDNSAEFLRLALDAAA